MTSGFPSPISLRLGAFRCIGALAPVVRFEATADSGERCSGGRANGPRFHRSSCYPLSAVGEFPFIPDCHPAAKNRRVGGGATLARSETYPLGGDTSSGHLSHAGASRRGGRRFTPMGSRFPASGLIFHRVGAAAGLRARARRSDCVVRSTLRKARTARRGRRPAF